ncbi:MAG: acetyl-CoA hydrolase/transferase C-terminal domain-containing protein, partial [Burkholderiaceae bacterium]|nr:acetyl-CoA hydrolase/transferase C-terminal domain-containing protein [Burkholderiaceae bacterium]
MGITTQAFAARNGAAILTACAVRGLETEGGNVSAVVTEHGVAQLHGQSQTHLVRSLLTVADPRFHEMLRKAAQFTLQGTVNLADETKVNLLIEHRKSLYEGMRLQVVNLNRELEDSAWSTVEIDPSSRDKLRWRVASVEKKPRPSLAKGIRDLKVFEGDVDLLLDAAAAFGCARVDIE